MKNLVLSLMVLLVVIGVTAPMVGDTFASFSDIETSEGNYIETGDLDLKVDGKDDWQVDTCFEIDDGEICTQYECTVPLWNAGSVDGTAYLHIKNLVGPDNLSQNVDVVIWYEGSQVTSGSINDLACHQIELGEMPGDGIIKEVLMELHAWAGAPGEHLTFDIAFELFGHSFSDVETSRGNYFGLNCELGGTHGFWGGSGALSEYGETETEAKTQIASWFREIVLSSAWFENELAEGNDDEVYAKMVGILGNTGVGNEYEGAVNQFRLQYLATRLNTMPDPPRLALGTLHNITKVPSDGGYIDASVYFDFDIGTLERIIYTIESNETDGDIFAAPPIRDDILIMKDVCDALNNVKI